MVFIEVGIDTIVGEILLYANNSLELKMLVCQEKKRLEKWELP